MFKEFTKGILRENPIFIVLLGLCPTLAMTKGLTVSDVAASIHIHPTLSEAVMEAALKAGGMAIHCVN